MCTEPSPCKIYWSFVKMCPGNLLEICLIGFLIASRVDYCNSVLYGLSSQVIRRLQMVLNAAARLVVSVGRYEHITPALRDVLHWLPVPQRTQSKIAISAFDCVCEHCPAYFNNVCIPVAGISGRANMFGRTPRHACPFDKNTAWPKKYPCCSPSRLERASITSPLIIH